MAKALPPREYDLFLSHATPDKPWVLTLAQRLEALGLRVFLDALAIDPGDNWVIRLNDALECSRYLVLVLSHHTEGRPWVIQEWTAYMAGHGPLGRLLPVRIDAVKLPFILSSTQAIQATHRDAQQVADALFQVVGDPATLAPDDARRLVLGRDLVFTLSREAEQLTVIPPSGKRRQMSLPWKRDTRFGLAHFEFTRLHPQAITDTATRTDLFRHARTLGGLLFETLFDAAEAATLEGLIGPDRPRAVIQVRSNDALLLALPWELLHHRDQFLVRTGQVDLVRTLPAEVSGATLLKAPTAPFKLVVNVSAPAGSGLHYEAESYRITLATAERCPTVPTELGTLTDLIETVDREAPTGIHFSGHGQPGALLFEDDEGRDDAVPVEQLIQTLRERLPDARTLPPFFYLASCHGNDPGHLEENEAGSASAVVQLHRAGVTEVVGYFGPIVDALSTRAEEALYEAIAEGLPTRDAVRRARVALAQPLGTDNERRRAATAPVLEPALASDPFPFAWAQLVYYHRGPEWPLSVPSPAGQRRDRGVLRRTFTGFGNRRVLRTGFIGRRTEQHRIRRRLRQGARVLVFQGLGGLGKSTLAQQVLAWLTDDPANVCTLWCQEVEAAPQRADALVGQLLAYARGRFGLAWEGVVQQVDRLAGDDAAQCFGLFLQALIEKIPKLVLYLDNLESLLVGPKDETAATAFADWAEPALATLWQAAQQLVEDADAVYLVASTRYRQRDFQAALLPVGPLPPDALFRLTDWFPTLQRLRAPTRARLVARLDGHPRAVEYAEDLVKGAFTNWQHTHGDWALPEPPADEDLAREWTVLVAPALPEVAQDLKDNLLFQTLWDRVLDDRARQFLYRMTVLRRPAAWALLSLLGEEAEPEAQAVATAERLRDTSLLEQLEVLAPVSEDHVGTIIRYSLHPATAAFIRAAHAAAPALLLGAHRRLGTYLEAAAKTSPFIETDLEAGYHLFEAGQLDRAYALLGRASDWLQDHGRVREGLQVLTSFLDAAVQAQMDRRFVGQLLGNLGNAYYRLGEVRKAIGYYEQALTILREIGDRQGEGAVLGNLGNAYADLGEVRKAIGYYEQRLTIAREIGDRQGEGAALGNLGLAYADLGEVRKAIGYYEQALAIDREIGDRQGEGNVLGNLGSAYYRLGEVRKAIGYYEQHLAIAREIGDRQGEGNVLGNLGSAYYRLGEVRKAIGYYEQHLAIAREIGDRQGEGNALGNLGNAYYRLGEVLKAIGYYEQHLAIAREIGDRQGEGAALGNLGNAYAALGEVEKAMTVLQQAQAIGAQIGDPQIIQVTTRGLEQLSKPE
jgi:tetratricopeptide (TPR) repeat protein